MAVRRIRVFLAAFVNQTNAQNINCRELARNLDKKRFEVYTLQINHGNLPGLDIEGVRVLNCWFPVKVTGRIGYLWGVYRSDIVYLPRADFLGWQKLLLKIFKRKSIKTIENIIDGEALKTALAAVGDSVEEAVNYYKYCNQNHPITNFVGEYNLKHHGLKYDMPVLNTPTDTDLFKKSKFKRSEEFSDVLFVGNDFKRKRLSEFIEVANHFPLLKFHVVGRGDVKPFEAMIINDNVDFHGVLKHHELVDLFHKVHLHFLPSRSEGFGKVTIECGASGLPSILYSDYGAAEWIDHGNDGIIVNTFDEVIYSIEELRTNPKYWQVLSQGAKSMSAQFDSRVLIETYEKVFEDMYYLE